MEASEVADERLPSAAILPGPCPLPDARLAGGCTATRPLQLHLCASSEREKFGKRHRVQDAVRRHAALPGHLDAPMHVVKLADRVGVGINAEYAAIRERFYSGDDDFLPDSAYEPHEGSF